MCGRFGLSGKPDKLAEPLGLPALMSFTPRYNVAPTQDILAARNDPGEVEGARSPQGQPQWATMRWGFQGKFLVINARSETVLEKPMFRDALGRRCLIFADGFYEWKRLGKEKTPYLFRLKSREPFCLAGLWSELPVGQERRACCVIMTTAANDVVTPCHERMPVILDTAESKRWLDATAGEADAVALLKAYPAEHMERIAVSSRVNSYRFDDPACMEPV